MKFVAWAFAALLLVPAAGSAGECAHNQNPARAGSAAQATGGRPPSSSDHPQPKFWVDPKLRAELGITDQQAAQIETIWQNGLPQRSETRTNLEKLEAQLDQMMHDASLDEAAFMAQFDKVEAARTEANKARMLMLYRINKVLNADQRAKLAAKAKAMRDGRGDHR
jgi:Spy/CpxP family protein refolding chaperone